MSSIVIVSGAPGSGKTTLGESLARERPQGLHLLSDLFYGFPAQPIDPSRPESRAQNNVIMRALARSARTFAEGGYSVVLDGVIGPWWLPLLGEELASGPATSYLILRTSEPEAVRRVRSRDGPGPSPTVRSMVPQFADLGAYERHAIDTEGSAPDEVLRIAREGLAARRFELTWEES